MLISCVCLSVCLSVSLSLSLSLSFLYVYFVYDFDNIYNWLLRCSVILSISALIFASMHVRMRFFILYVETTEKQYSNKGRLHIYIFNNNNNNNNSTFLLIFNICGCILVGCRNSVLSFDLLLMDWNINKTARVLCKYVLFIYVI